MNIFGWFGALMETVRAEEEELAAMCLDRDAQEKLMRRKWKARRNSAASTPAPSTILTMLKRSLLVIGGWLDVWCLLMYWKHSRL
jgi:hypothetical protein